MVDGAALEKRFPSNRDVGSNPTLSAIVMFNPKDFHFFPHIGYNEESVARRGSAVV